MSIYLEITQLENGDIVLRESEDQSAGAPAREAHEVADSAGLSDREPLVRISFSAEVKDMLGNELVDVAEAMIDAATDFLGGDVIEVEEARSPPVIH